MRIRNADVHIKNQIVSNTTKSKDQIKQEWHTVRGQAGEYLSIL